MAQIDYQFLSSKTLTGEVIVAVKREGGKIVAVSDQILREDMRKSELPHYTYSPAGDWEQRHGQVFIPVAEYEIPE